MVSNASELLPLPLKPVMTVSLSRGIVTSMFLRLCSRAPRTTRASSDTGRDRARGRGGTRESCPPPGLDTSRRIGKSSGHGGEVADASGERTDVVVVLTTVGSEDAAAAFVGALLEQRLVACGGGGADAVGGGTGVVVVVTRVGREDAAAAFVGALLEQRLVACGTVLPAARS